MFENRVDKDKISSFLKDQLNTLFKNRRFPNISWKMYSPFNLLSGRVANIRMFMSGVRFPAKIRQNFQNMHL